MSAMRRLPLSVASVALLCVLAAATVFAIRGYMAPDTMLYFLTFKWCS